MYKIGEYDARKCNSMLKAVIMMILIATACIEFFIHNSIKLYSIRISLIQDLCGDLQIMIIGIFKDVKRCRSLFCVSNIRNICEATPMNLMNDNLEI